MANNVHVFDSHQFVFLTNLDTRGPDESYLHLPSRHTDSSLHQMLAGYVARADHIVAALPAEADAGVLHSDFFREVRVLRLPAGYRAELPAARSPRSEAATGLHVIAGALHVDEVAASGTRGRMLVGADTHLFHDRHAHHVHAPTDTLVLQMVSPRPRHGGLSLPVPTRAQVPTAVAADPLSPISAPPAGRSARVGATARSRLPFGAAVPIGDARRVRR